MLRLIQTIFGFMIGAMLSAIAGMTSRLHTTPTGGTRKIARRGFVRNAALGAVVVILAQVGGGFVRFFWPNKTGAFGKEIIVPGTDVPPVDGTPLMVTTGKFFIVHTPDGLMALYTKCPHLGCAVPWNAGASQFQCPCHGSIYDPTGVRLGGPAPRPMDYMALRVDAATGDVVVDTGDIKTRSGYDPSQAVPF